MVGDENLRSTLPSLRTVWLAMKTYEYLRLDSHSWDKMDIELAELDDTPYNRGERGLRESKHYLRYPNLHHPFIALQGHPLLFQGSKDMGLSTERTGISPW
jgi:hypothetical protein